MERQLNFDFIPPEAQNDNKLSIPDFESLSLKDLYILYKEKVGVNAEVRGFDEATIIAAIKNPEAEIERLRQIDRESDKEDIDRTYRS